MNENVILLIYVLLKIGGVVEWPKAPVLKTGVVQATVGSNPTPSAIFFNEL